MDLRSTLVIVSLLVVELFVIIGVVKFLTEHV